MIVKLGKGFWVDATDGLNWTLRKGDPEPEKKKKGMVLGYHPNLAAAIDAAIRKECFWLGGHLIEVRDVAKAVEGIAAEILAEVVITNERDPEMGVVKRFKLGASKAPVAGASRAA